MLTIITLAGILGVSAAIWINLGFDSRFNKRLQQKRSFSLSNSSLEEEETTTEIPFYRLLGGSYTEENGYKYYERLRWLAEHENQSFICDNPACLWIDMSLPSYQNYLDKNCSGNFYTEFCKTKGKIQIAHQPVEIANIVVTAFQNVSARKQKLLIKLAKFFAEISNSSNITRSLEFLKGTGFQHWPVARNKQCIDSGQFLEVIGALSKRYKLEVFFTVSIEETHTNNTSYTISCNAGNMWADIFQQIELHEETEKPNATLYRIIIEILSAQNILSDSSENLASSIQRGYEILKQALEPDTNEMSHIFTQQSDASNTNSVLQLFLKEFTNNTNTTEVEIKSTICVDRIANIFLGNNSDDINGLYNFAGFAILIYLEPTILGTIENQLYDYSAMVQARQAEKFYPDEMFEFYKGFLNGPFKNGKRMARYEYQLNKLLEKTRSAVLDLITSTKLFKGFDIKKYKTKVSTWQFKFDFPTNTSTKATNNDNTNESCITNTTNVFRRYAEKQYNSSLRMSLFDLESALVLNNTVYLPVTAVLLPGKLSSDLPSLFFAILGNSFAKILFQELQTLNKALMKSRVTTAVQCLSYFNGQKWRKISSPEQKSKVLIDVLSAITAFKVFQETKTNRVTENEIEQFICLQTSSKCRFYQTSLSNVASLVANIVLALLDKNFCFKSITEQLKECLS